MTHTIEALANLFILNIYRAVTAKITAPDATAALAIRRAALVLVGNAPADVVAEAIEHCDYFVKILEIHEGDTAYNVRRIGLNYRDFDDHCEWIGEWLEEVYGIDAHLFAFASKSALVEGPFALAKAIRKSRSAAVCQLSLGL